jgi:hypothetical protein
MKAMVVALQTGKASGAINPVGSFPDNGIVDKADVSNFTPEWPG